MKGNDKLIERLNSLLADELTAINEYMVHSEMAGNWGYVRLHDMIEGRAIMEMKHAEKLIGRIIFLEGRPVVGTLRDIRIGQTVPEQFKNDLALEMGAVHNYNEAIVLAGEVKDYATREILERILQDEDGHVDQIEENQDQIEQTTLPVYLSQQIRKDGE
jgi:bacterioferritin